MLNAYSVPISVKGIVFQDEKVWLRRNERNEWELPGGKLDNEEQPEKAVVRELKEELGFEVEVADIIQANLYQIEKSRDESKGVLVISYLCRLINRTGGFEIESEAGKAKFEKFSVEEVESLNMPLFYKEAIRKAFEVK